LPIGDVNRAVNVDWSRKDPGSMLALYQQLLRLRRAEPVLVTGQLTEINASEGLLQFVRTNGKRRFRVMINLGEEARRIPVEAGVIAACTKLGREGDSVNEGVRLEAADAVIIETTDAAFA
jgi:alpha-glucosidase